MKIIYIITLFLASLPFVKDKEKTKKAIQIAGKRLYFISPILLGMVIFISIILYLCPAETIAGYLSPVNKAKGVLLAATIGSFAVFPGFIAFPLCGILRTNGVSYMVLSAFSTTLMLVGIATYPLEKYYFGRKATIIRNVAGFIMSIIVAIVTGIFYGEIF